MKRLLLSAVILGLGTLAQAAQPDAAALEKIGAEVKQAGGAIIEVKADCTKFGPDEYALIGQVESLKNLSLSGPGFTDENLAALEGLKNLESILLNVTQLTDDGFKQFAAFPKLKRLSLFHISRNNEKFNGSGLAHLKNVPSLERLTFAGATSDDQYLAAVGQITQLKDFSFWHNWESPEGIKHLLKLPHLSGLRIGQRLPARGRPLTPSLTDATLGTIAQMKAMERLQLMEGRFTLDGLKQLTALPKLSSVAIRTSAVSAADVEALRQALPETKIEFEPLSEQEEEELLVKKLKL